MNLAVESLNSNISKILNTLNSFGNYNFKVKTQIEIKCCVTDLIDGINKLGDEISIMLKASLKMVIYCFQILKRWLEW